MDDGPRLVDSAVEGNGRLLAFWFQQQVKTREHLTNFVMQLACQMMAFGLLHFEEPPGKGLEPGRVLLQGLFRLSKLGDVLSRSDKAYRLAGLVEDDLSPVIQYTNAAVRAGDAVIGVEGATLANGLVHERAHRIHVLRQEKVEELLVGEADPLALVEQAVQFIGPSELIGA